MRPGDGDEEVVLALDGGEDEGVEVGDGSVGKDVRLLRLIRELLSDTKLLDAEVVIVDVEKEDTGSGLETASAGVENEGGGA